MKVLWPAAVVMVLVGAALAGAQAPAVRPLLAIVLPYAAGVLFLGGLVWRVAWWARSPVPFRIPTTCGQQRSLPWIPAARIENPSTGLGAAVRVLLEVVLFRSLFRNVRSRVRPDGRLVQESDKLLWAGALAFHASFAIILLRHARFFFDPVPGFVHRIQAVDGFLSVGVPEVYLSTVVFVAAAGFLLGRRLLDPRIRYLSLPADYLPLLLLLAIAFTGVLLRHVVKTDLLAVKSFALSLAAFHPGVPAGAGSWLYAHLLVVCVLAAYFPFSKLVHMAGVFLSPTRNLANDNRARRHVNPWNPQVEVHAYEHWEREFRDKLEAGVDFEARKGSWCYPATPKALNGLGFPNARAWAPTDADWKLPDGWEETLRQGFRDRLGKYRSLKLFLDSCVRCGACADKCHFYIGSGDPKNMPVLRAELVRSVYRNDFSVAGRLLGALAGARPLTVEVLKEWYYYFYQCTECRRCSVFCPYGIDTAEITMFARELLNLVGLNVNWVQEPAANCDRFGNHLGIPPHTMKDNIDFLCDELEEVTGIRVAPSFNRKGAEFLFVTPSADFFAEPGIYTFMGYLLLFHQIGLDYTLSAYASEGGNFGLFTSHETMKRLNAKMYLEAKRLGVKSIIGGECGHMWRVVHQYMGTMNGPADFLEVPVSPVTGTRFEHAASTKMIHVCEFTADLLHHGRLALDPSRNDGVRVTFHDSCNPARALGMFEEPRAILRSACRHVFEMPEGTTREQTFCCGSGAGLGNDENLEMRMRGGLPRASAVKWVRDRHQVNTLACMCAIDRATLTTLMEFWVPEVGVSGVHELLGNALVMEGEKARTTDLRGRPLPGGEEVRDA